MTVLAPPTLSADAVRTRLVRTLRRDLVGPGPDDTDLERERLPAGENPSRWYLAGFLVPQPDATAAASAEAVPDEPGDPLFGEDSQADPDTGGARAADDAPPDEPSARPSRLPSSLGLTVLLDVSVMHVDVTVTWGDYVPVPPITELELAAEGAGERKARGQREWQRVPGRARVRLKVPQDGRGDEVLLENSGGAVAPGGALTLLPHARPYSVVQPDGSVTQLRVLTVMLVNRRAPRTTWRDICYAFQVRLAITCESGLAPRHDLSGHGAADLDRTLADLQYRDVAEYGVGRNTSAGWTADADGVVRTAFTDAMPQAEVERVESNDGIADVVFDMEALAEKAATGADALRTALEALPRHYAAWIATQKAGIGAIVGSKRQAVAARLIDGASKARARMEDGIALLLKDAIVRRAFQAMNLAVARAARQRNAGQGGDPGAQRPPAWRPFQLAFILLNLRGLADRTHDDREIVDLLFFPTGGGKTEAYLGLAAWTIAHRRLSASGLLGAGVAVLMRYTLRLLTLDQLGRAAGVICALELMRESPEWREGEKRLLGDWPIEIGLWVGSSATPNRLGKKGKQDPATALARVRRYRADKREAPAPIKACPWCATPFTPDSFACVPAGEPRNMEIRCTNSACPFAGRRALPVLTVDEAIYRRLPAFLIATVDKFAGLPWIGESGAFFGHVDRADEWGFYGANDPPGVGRKLWNDAQLDPPSLIVQDELHLISGPLGTVAALYEVALDRLASRQWMGKTVRPKVVASTATVRRAQAQIKALFDRSDTAIFPPPGPDRRDSFFALTRSASEVSARLYLGIAAPGRGPKLIFLRVLSSILAAAERARIDGHDADPFLTALCYFNALRELGGARRIVEDEVRARIATYGTKRRRAAPPDQPFADRGLREVLELTSRVSTDQVSAAKERLGRPTADPKHGVDVALATNMISVGLDIGRLGLMLVQGQPKSAAEYIQATSRVGRERQKPGLVIAVLNAHKPRDRLHYERFRDFHAGFYRAVEATSVTPWSARALDRALAAVVVATARHLAPELTQEACVDQLRANVAVRQAVVDAVVARAPDAEVVGGRAALRKVVEQLLDDWVFVADRQTANGDAFYFGYPREKALLHQPLDPLLTSSIDMPWRRFTAARSMRDVEHVSVLKLIQPNGMPLVQ